MFDLDLAAYSMGDDYDSWLINLSEASARLDALQTAVLELRRLLRCGDPVHRADILEVLERHGV
jgi:hypothetical protein